MGDRDVFMPGSRGFDYYLGIPYSDDMGAGRFTPCGGGKPQRVVNKPDGLAYLPEVKTAHDPLGSSRDRPGLNCGDVYRTRRPSGPRSKS